MKNIRIIQSLSQKKPLKLGILTLTTALIISGSMFAYANMVYEKPLNIGNTSGTTGQGPTPPSQAGIDPATIVIVAVLAVVTSLSVYEFLHEARQTRKTPEPSPSTEKPPIPPEDDEWEEAPAHGRN